MPLSGIWNGAGIPSSNGWRTGKGYVWFYSLKIGWVLKNLESQKTKSNRSSRDGRRRWLHAKLWHDTLIYKHFLWIWAHKAHGYSSHWLGLLTQLSLKSLNSVCIGGFSFYIFMSLESHCFVFGFLRQDFFVCYYFFAVLRLHESRVRKGLGGYKCTRLLQRLQLDFQHVEAHCAAHNHLWPLHTPARTRVINDKSHDSGEDAVHPQLCKSK